MRIHLQCLQRVQSYKILTFEEMQNFFSNRDVFLDKGVIITELGSKFLVIRWNKVGGS